MSLLLPIALVFFLSPAAAASRTFPGQAKEIRSPDGVLTLFWWEPDAGSSKHSLLLKAAGSPKSWRIYEFDRSVSVEWSSRGHLLAITDRKTTDGSTTFVYNPDTQESVDVCAGPIRALGSKWANAHQRYCELAGWQSPGALRLRLWGSGSDGDFDTKTTVAVK